MGAGGARGSDARLAASWNSLLSCRAVIGVPGTRPGKSQRSRGAMPASWFVGRSRHHCRDSANAQGGSMTSRSLRPLDCTMRMMLRTVDVARAQPYHFAGPKAAAIGQRQHYPHRSDFAAVSNYSTSSALSPAGSSPAGAQGRTRRSDPAAAASPGTGTSPVTILLR
jgi:hypothetical protein